MCLGILRVALMYEGCGVDLFGWGSTSEILTGLEHSLLVFNASAYPTGLKNRKMGPKKSKKSYTFEECLAVEADFAPNSKFPIVTSDIATGNDDVEMVEATIADETAEGTGFGAAAPSTEAGPSGTFVASGDEAAKRRRITPQVHAQLQGLFENALNSLQCLISKDSVCANCLSTEHRLEDCARSDASEWYNMLTGVRNSVVTRNSVLAMENQEVSISSTEDPMEISKEEEGKEETMAEQEQPKPSKSEDNLVS